MFSRRISSLLLSLISILFLIVNNVGASSSQKIKPNPPNGHWIDTWTSMPQLTESANLPPAPFNQSGAVFVNSTIRQTLHMSVGASQIRIRISNAFGVTNLPITAVTVALPVNGSAGVSAIQPSTLQTVTFSGNDSISIPNGGLAVSDPLNFRIKPQSMITVTIYLEGGQLTNSITSHPGSRTTSWFGFGNQVNAGNISVTNSTVQSAQHWYFLSAVEAWTPKESKTFALVGDSITDGRGSDTDKNDRWPDLLLARLQKSPSTSNIAIANQAAGGNRILADGLGPAALGRIERDVIAQSGVSYALIFEGVNDIGTADTTPSAQSAIYDSLIQAYKQMITRMHTVGIPVFGATITPFSAPNGTAQQPYSDPERENTRQRINAWIRGSGEFDGVVDFDAVVRDPEVPSQLRGDWQSGDYLHPNVMGYMAMANAFPVGLFGEFEDGVDGFM